MPAFASHGRSISRRRLLGGGIGGAAGLAALGLGFSRWSGSARSIASAQTGPWSGGELPVAARSSQRMAGAARAFLNRLSADQASSIMYPDLSDQARTRWSNFPASLSPRAGLPLGALSETQRILLHDLLRASTSSQGYHKMIAAIQADQVLSDLQGGDQQFGAANYYVTVFGSPEDANWAWMLTGHHMTAIFTVAGERTAFTPMFTGAQPLQNPSSIYAGWHVLPQEASRAGELLAALSPDQQGAAIISASAPGDVVAGPGRQTGLSSFMSIPASRLDDAQQRLLWLLVQEFVRNADADAAEAQLALIQQSWGDTHFAWMGPSPRPDARYYFRIHGPRILIEYDVQEPLTRQGGHIHAITRDPVNDYGADWLGLHYQETASLPGPGGGPPGPPPGGAVPIP